HRGETDLPWINAIAARYADIKAAGAEVLAVGPSALASLPFPSLLDQPGRLAASLGLEVPAVIVADRPGEVWAAWGAGDPASLPSPDDILAWLEYAQSESRECACGDLVWPAELMQPR